MSWKKFFEILPAPGDIIGACAVVGFMLLALFIEPIIDVLFRLLNI